MFDRSLMKTLAVFEMAALSLLLAQVWFLALANGGRVTIAIDAYGEAGLEFVLWLVLTPVLVLGLHYYVVD